MKHKIAVRGGFVRFVRIIDIKSVIVAILIPLAVGGFSASLSGDVGQIYAELDKPPLSPSASVFPIVWTILYILMGISSYLIWDNYRRGGEGRTGLIIYAIQLLLSFCWPIIFFRFGLLLPAFIVLCLLIIAVVAMLIAFGRVIPFAAEIQIPYLIWCIFGGYLNLAIFIFN